MTERSFFQVNTAVSKFLFLARINLALRESKQKIINRWLWNHSIKAQFWIDKVRSLRRVYVMSQACPLPCSYLRISAQLGSWSNTEQEHEHAPIDRWLSLRAPPWRHPHHWQFFVRNERKHDSGNGKYSIVSLTPFYLLQIHRPNSRCRYSMFQGQCVQRNDKEELRNFSSRNLFQS